MQQVLLSHVTGHVKGEKGEVERVKEEFIDRDEPAFKNMNKYVSIQKPKFAGKTNMNYKERK